VISQELKDKIKNIETTYKKAVTLYEKLLDLKTVSKKTEKQDELFADAIDLLSQLNYASANATLTSLNRQIDDEKAKIVTSFTIPVNVATNNSPPNSGYSRQQVQSDIGTYLVDIISADLNSTRVIVDTASDSDCSTNCPVLALSDYVSRNGAFAGVNGSYFCPAEYPSCAGKTNSYDTLLMNKNKKYFNSDNNKYSSVPLIYFSGNSAGIRGQSLEWGRDTGIDAVLANQGLLLSGGNIVFGGDSDPKKGSKGLRSFVGNKGSTVYIGVVHNVTVAEVAHVLKTLGLENALNLDSGGSVALWSAGYKAGPGRNIPMQYCL
jgi:exopolysaccharide biosynthesis protein